MWEKVIDITIAFCSVTSCAKMCITIRHHYFDSNVKLSTNILSSNTNRNESEKAKEAGCIA